jgi:hypothetical protein
MIDREMFFDQVRETIYSGSLTADQVACLDAALDCWILYSLRGGGAGKLRGDEMATDIRWLAYILATAWHEARSVPVRETFARFDKDVHLSASYAAIDAESGERFYGRGLVQLTHKSGYAGQSELWGVDLVAAPDIALGMHAANLIMFAGMILGSFTGKKLADYINEDGCDYFNARRIVNGTDKAELIADYAEAFEAALIDAGG